MCDEQTCVEHGLWVARSISKGGRLVEQINRGRLNGPFVSACTCEHLLRTFPISAWRSDRSSAAVRLLPPSNEPILVGQWNPARLVLVGITLPVMTAPIEFRRPAALPQAAWPARILSHCRVAPSLMGVLLTRRWSQ